MRLTKQGVRNLDPPARNGKRPMEHPNVVIDRPVYDPRLRGWCTPESDCGYCGGTGFRGCEYYDHHCETCHERRPRICTKLACQVRP